MTYFIAPGTKKKRRPATFDLTFFKTNIVTLKVAKHFKINPYDLPIESREEEIMYPRQVAMYLLKTVKKMSFSEIGRRFDRDHSTVMSSFHRIKDLMDTEEKVRFEIEQLSQHL